MHYAGNTGGIHVNVKTGFVIGTFKNGWETSYRQTNDNVAFVKRAKELLAADSVQLYAPLNPKKQGWSMKTRMQTAVWTSET